MNNGMVMEKRLPRIVLKALEGGESKFGKLILILGTLLFLMFAVIFVMTPEPWSEKIPAGLGILGGYAVYVAYGIWILRKPYRVHRMALAKVLRDRPQDVVSVHEIAIRPSATGQGIVTTRMAFDGEREFAPRPQRSVRVLGMIKVIERSQIFVKVKGKWLRKKMVVPFDVAPELLSWLFATMAAANPECKWGDKTIGTFTG